MFLNLIYDKYKSKIIYYLIWKIILHVHEARWNAETAQYYGTKVIHVLHFQQA